MSGPARPCGTASPAWTASSPRGWTWARGTKPAEGTRAIYRPAIVDVAALDAEGSGIALLDGRTVKISGVIPGEQVELRILGTTHGQPQVELIRVVRPSTKRVEPVCRHAGTCGGCTWQHIAYPEQLRLKQERLRQLLEKSLGAQAPPVDPAIGVRAGGNPPQRDARDPAAPWGFRNKVSFVFGPGRGGQPLVMGHYQLGTSTIVPVEECPVHAAAGNTLAFRMRDALRDARVPGAAADGRNGVARHLVVRVAHNRPEALATLVVTANDKGLRGVVRRIVEGAGAPDGLHLNIHDGPGPYLFGKATRKLHGRDRLREDVAGVSFLVSPTSFFQTNVAAAEALVGAVLNAVSDRPPRRVLDLYAGVGLFALPLARRGHQVIAVEESADAVADGEASRWFSKISDEACRFVRGRVEELIGSRPGGLAGASRPDVVVLDPPRPGCPERLLRALAGAVRPANVVYVSCNPDALARDLTAFVAGNYRIERVRPVDMFPHTAHIEAVAFLSLAR